MSDDILPSGTNVALNAMTETAKPLWGAVGETLGTAWQGLLGDRVALWRMKRAIPLSVAYQNECKSLGVLPQVDRMPSGYVVTWFNHSTEADEPELQILFAKILAQATIGNADALAKRNIYILGRLSPAAALLLDNISHYIYTRAEEINTSIENVQFSLDYITFSMKMKAEYRFEDPQAVEDLVNVGILSETFVASLKDRSKYQIESILHHPLSVQNRLEFSLTLTGLSLIRALHPNGYRSLG